MAELEKIALRVQFPKHEDAPAIFANQVAAQFVGDVYIVTFYGAFPPLLLGEDAAAVKDPLEVTAKCVARLAIPAERMGEIVKALSTNVEQSQSVLARRQRAGEGER